MSHDPIIPLSFPSSTKTMMGPSANADVVPEPAPLPPQGAHKTLLGAGPESVSAIETFLAAPPPASAAAASTTRRRAPMTLVGLAPDSEPLPHAHRAMPDAAFRAVLVFDDGSASEPAARGGSGSLRGLESLRGDESRRGAELRGPESRGPESRGPESRGAGSQRWSQASELGAPRSSSPASLERSTLVSNYRTSAPTIADLPFERPMLAAVGVAAAVAVWALMMLYLFSL